MKYTLPQKLDRVKFQEVLVFLLEEELLLELELVPPPLDPEELDGLELPELEEFELFLVEDFLELEELLLFEEEDDELLAAGCAPETLVGAALAG